MTLYNCKVDGDQYRITKFTSDLDVESTYLLTETECECPAGHRPTCRHRTMLPRFVMKSATSGQFFHDYDSLRWFPATLEGLDPSQESPEPIPPPHPSQPSPSPSSLPPIPPLPPGINLLSLTDIEGCYNAIASALGEPTLPPSKPLRRI